MRTQKGETRFEKDGVVGIEAKSASSRCKACVAHGFGKVVDHASRSLAGYGRPVLSSRSERKLGWKGSVLIKRKLGGVGSTGCLLKT